MEDAAQRVFPKLGDTADTGIHQTSKKLFHYTPRRRLGGEELQLLLILYLETRWGEWSASLPGRALASGKGGWVGPRAGLDTRGYRKNPFASAGDRTSIARTSSP
jgi:hypothetical protein